MTVQQHCLCVMSPVAGTTDFARRGMYYGSGILIVAEAGGKVTDFRGRLFSLAGSRNEVLATNGKIHETMLQCLNDEEAA